MSHTSEKRWRSNQYSGQSSTGVSELVTNICTEMLQVLTTAEAAYREMQELYSYAGGTVQLLADQLFFEDWSTRLADPQVPDVYETQANAAEVAKATDLFNAVTALYELHQAADNVAVTQEDRYAQLRRMS